VTRHGDFKQGVNLGYSNLMAQKPGPNALILELEPVVAQNLDRHLETEELWFAHDYVPFEQGENFAFLGGRDWDPSEVTLPKHITDALEILLIQKDNLAGYHREFVFSFLLEDKWGRWLGRWTAEEHLHAIALRNYLVVTREIDPAANEDVRVEHVMKGYRADTYSQIERLVFMAFYERAYAVYCRNLEAQINEPVLNGLMGRIASDEERHEEFFHNLVAHLLEYSRDETIDAIARRAADMDVVGADIDAYTDKVQVVADAGIFDEATLRQVISDRIAAWGLADEPRLHQFVNAG
jgi:acyl-[acyl-carrier-protein] desaturase